MKNYYKILGVQKNASPQDIKNNYLKLAHIYHPDKNGGDEERFREINEAYQTLSNYLKRREYDRQNFTDSNLGRSNEQNQNTQRSDSKKHKYEGAGVVGFAIILIFIIITVPILFLDSNTTPVDSNSSGNTNTSVVQNKRESSNKTEESRPTNTQQDSVTDNKCAGNLADLIFADNKYQMFNLYNIDPCIGSNIKTIKLYGVIKNNSKCAALNIKLRVTITDKNNPDMKQEETLDLNKMCGVRSPIFSENSKDEGIKPNETKEYNLAFTAFSSFIETNNPTMPTSSSLIPNAIINTSIISADWSKPTQ